MKSTFLFCILLFSFTFLNAQLNIKASRELLQRILPEKAGQFLIEPLAAGNQDSFEIEASQQQIILRGNNGVAVASAFYYYLKEFCHCQITWNGTNLSVPEKLPIPVEKIAKSTPYEYRYYMNYCTFNYSMSWWDWARWEKEIDWMALHGINMPLAITGEEDTWYQVYREMGFTDDDLKGFFCGPSYFSWFWMGNLDAYGGPLPRHWMQSHAALQKKILERERELGMKPVLPAFTGHVPPSFQKKFPAAKLKTTNWTNGFADTYILDSEDPLFAEIGKRFLQKQTKLYGTDHLYSADTFNENEPPSDEPAFLSKLSARVYQGMKQADSSAIWVMQGWLFYSDRKFWKAPQIEALLNAVPDNKMLLLDLAAEIEPVWKHTRSFYGKPWIWNMLNNFGGNTNLFGRIEEAAKGPATAWNDPSKNRMKGIGLTMEAIEQNPVLYELMMDNTWRTQSISLDTWLPDYILDRYQVKDPHTLKAWQILRKTVYNGKLIRDGSESIIQARPTLDSITRWTQTKLNYPAADLLPAWDEIIKAGDACKQADGFQFDLVDLTRQVLANYALPLQQKWVKAFREKNQRDTRLYSKVFLELIDDLDDLLATRKDFLLGRWITDARNCGTTDTEKALYEMNARNLITLWGDQNCSLHEYACRQWNGLLKDFYKPRWARFFTMADQSLTKHIVLDVAGFQEKIAGWEWSWVNERKDYRVKPTGDPVVMSKKLYTKYRKQIENCYLKN